jgi:regulator of protease activity HflC (stomatin/prohibitin superfamily)
MELGLEATVGIIGLATTGAALLLGYLSERKLLAAGMLGFFAAMASGICFAGVLIGGWAGLLAAILVVAYLAYRVGGGFGKKRGSVFVLGLWLAYCGSCAVGYSAGDWVGLLTITLPSLLIFWGAMFVVSASLLPLSDRSQRMKAFRSLCTYSAGTNYPFHVVDDRELEERAAGNPFGMFFAGPGIILTRPSHAPIIWDGLKFKRIADPGLTFTDRMEMVYQHVDLRPQLRSFNVLAITKDAIRIQVMTFVPFRLYARGLEPSLGASFPLDRGSIYKAVWQQPVEEGEKVPWDEVVQIVATRALRRIISKYEYDELCEPFETNRNPRSKITAELIDTIRRELQSWGIEVIGGGIGNLEPEDKSITEKRIKAWRAKWESAIMAEIGQGEANAIQQLEKAHTDAQVDLLNAIRGVVQQQPDIGPDVLAKIAALRFIEALEETACSPEVRKELSSDTTATIDYLKQALVTE